MVESIPHVPYPYSSEDSSEEEDGDENGKLNRGDETVECKKDITTQVRSQLLQ